MAIPASDGKLLPWSQTFDTVYGGDPYRWGGTPAEAANLHGLVQGYTTTMAANSESGTRCHATSVAKNQAKAALLAVLRPMCRQIMDNLGISAQDKVLLGLSLPDNQPNPIAAPTTAPILGIVGARALEHVLRYNDENTPNKRAKPKGAAALQLHCTVAETAPSDPEAAPIVAYVTRQPYVVKFPADKAKKTAYYWGRWQTRTGLVGPWSLLASMTIPAAA